MREPIFREPVAQLDPVGDAEIAHAAPADALLPPSRHNRLVPLMRKVSGSTAPSTSRSTKLSLSGVINVSRHRMRDVRQIIVVTEGVDDDDAVASGDVSRPSSPAPCSLAACSSAEGWRNAEGFVPWCTQCRDIRRTSCRCPDAPVLDVTGQASLPGIEIDRWQPHWHRLDRGRSANLHGDGGFSRLRPSHCRRDHTSRQCPHRHLQSTSDRPRKSDCVFASWRYVIGLDPADSRTE